MDNTFLLADSMDISADEALLPCVSCCPAVETVETACQDMNLTAASFWGF